MRNPHIDIRLSRTTNNCKFTLKYTTQYLLRNEGVVWGFLKELDSLTEQLETLIYKINLTNSKTTIDGTELTLLLAKRDVLKQKIVMLRNFLNTASAKVDRYSRTEIKILSSVDVTKLQKQIDVLSKEYRTIDEKIQGANWTTELL